MAEWIENKYKDYLGYIPNMKTDGSQGWSMVEVFGKVPPYTPEEFSKLCPRTKLTGSCKEGNSFCSSCGTLTPDIPMSHHKSCDNFIHGAGYYPTVEETWWLGVCPDCNTSDFPTLNIDSSIELGISEISCSECDYCYQAECCGEDLVEMFLSGE